MTKAATAADFDWDIVEGGNTEFSAKYPRFQWIHGDKAKSDLMKTGGLFISKEEYPNFTGDGFRETTLITREGEEIPGYGASATNLAVIRVKQQWVKDDNGKNVPYRHVLCAVKGNDDLMCISLKGPSKALDFQKAFNLHIGQNVAMANRSRPEGKNAIEPFGLWFPLIAGPQHIVTSKDGKASSSVTSPEMFTPETLDRDYAVTLWVGAENYKRFAEYYRETKVWQDQPIWEQRTDNITEPEFTGGDGITQGQLDQIGTLMATKSLTEQDVQQFCLEASEGSTNKLGMLKREEARAVIDTLASY